MHNSKSRIRGNVISKAVDRSADRIATNQSRSFELSYVNKPLLAVSDHECRDSVSNRAGGIFLSCGCGVDPAGSLADIISPFFPNPSSGIREAELIVVGLCSPWQWMGYVGIRLQGSLLLQTIEFQGRLPNKMIPPQNSRCQKADRRRTGRAGKWSSRRV
jgi:hypothetical protein